MKPARVCSLVGPGLLVGVLPLLAATPTAPANPVVEGAAQAVALSVDAAAAITAWRELRARDIHGAPAWEGWRNARQVFLPGGADPGPWPDAVAPLATDQRFLTGATAATVPAKRVVSGHLQAFDPVLDAAHLNETHLNRVAFDYLRAQGLYNVEGQLARLSSGQAPDFPVGSVLVKGQWRPIDARDATRYHSMTLPLPGGGQRLYGLTAVNLSLKQRPGAGGWLFAAFEHADHCRDPAPQCSRAPADRVPVPAAAVWENYRLRGVMDRATDAQGRPVLLASSQLEEGVQHSSSCVTCHARTSIGLEGGQSGGPTGDHPARLSVLDLSRPPLPGDAVRGFTGAPLPEWFLSPADAPGGARRRYLPLDSVWALTLAQPRSAP